MTKIVTPWGKVFKTTINEYASASTADGIAYIFEPGRLIIERIFWVLVVLFAFVVR